MRSRPTRPWSSSTKNAAPAPSCAASQTPPMEVPKMPTGPSLAAVLAWASTAQRKPTACSARCLAAAMSVVLGMSSTGGAASPARSTRRASTASSFAMAVPSARACTAKPARTSSRLRLPALKCVQWSAMSRSKGLAAWSGTSTSRSPPGFRLSRSRARAARGSGRCSSTWIRAMASCPRLSPARPSGEKPSTPGSPNTASWWRPPHSSPLKLQPGLRRAKARKKPPLPQPTSARRPCSGRSACPRAQSSSRSERAQAPPPARNTGCSSPPLWW